MSVKIVIGRIPALRPRLPSREPVKTPSSGLASTKQGIWNAPVGEALEATVGKPQALVGVFGATAFGRSVEVLKLKFWSVPVTMLNGRPELNSMIGASVQSLKNLPQKVVPTVPLWYMPLKTKRWRWSKVELARSRSGRTSFCGESRV